jgi:hypothetical protein
MKLLRYESQQNFPAPRWLRLLSRIFRFNIGTDRSEAHGATYAQLAEHVTLQGIEPGFIAKQTKENRGRGLDFYPLDPERDSSVVQWSWLSDIEEPDFKRTP